jgi:hypothetical protein
MKSGIWMFCVLFFMFIVAPVLMVLTFLGPIGAGPGTVFIYWLPVLLCAVSVAALIFYRQGVQGKQAQIN